MEWLQYTLKWSKTLRITLKKLICTQLPGTWSIEKSCLKINLENYLVYLDALAPIPFLILRYIYGENQESALRRADLFCNVILGQSWKGMFLKITVKKNTNKRKHLTPLSCSSIQLSLENVGLRAPNPMQSKISM